VCAARGSACAREAPVGEVQAETGHARVHGGARLVAMGGGKHGARDWVARTRRGARWCLGRLRTRRAFLWRPCARFPWPRSTRPSCAWRRARRRHKKGAQGSALPSRLGRTRAGVHACERRSPHGCARADTHATQTRRGRADTARRRRTVAASYAKRGEARRVARASTKAAAHAENGIPAWLEGRHHQQRRGGAGAFRLGPKAAASTGEVRRRPHLGGLWPKCRRR
jgi:hypothetical protein